MLTFILALRTLLFGKKPVVQPGTSQTASLSLRDFLTAGPTSEESGTDSYAMISPRSTLTEFQLVDKTAHSVDKGHLFEASDGKNLPMNSQNGETARENQAIPLPNWTPISTAVEKEQTCMP